MTPRLSVFPSDWGWLGMAVSERGLAGLILPRPSEEVAWADLHHQCPEGLAEDGDPWPELRQKLLDYLAGERVDFSDVPLDLPEGPPFWRQVWDACARIPYGETRSYTDLARDAGSPRACRAAGGAMANNPVPILVPCHRVVGSDGSLTGFGGGLPQKRRMLEMEEETRRHGDAERGGSLSVSPRLRVPASRP